MPISACLIVKDEAKLIRRCLACCRLFAKQVVVVDTGSKDDTQAIIRAEFPEVVLRVSERFTADSDPNDFNFGAARNESLALATEQWTCLAPGQPVVTDNGLKPIESIAVGDSVLTHQGRYRCVTEMKTRPYTGDIVSIRARSNGYPLEITPEHRVLAIKGYRCHLKCGNPCLPNCRKQLKKTRTGTTPNCKKPYLGYRPEWIAAGELDVGDIVLFPVVRLGGGGGRDKRIPRWLLEMPDRFVAGLFRGWYEGDGCEGRDAAVAKTVNPNIVFAMRQALARLGVPSSYDRYVNRFGDVFNFTVGGAAMGDLEGAIGITHPFSQNRSKSYQLSYVDSNFIYMPIVDISRRSYDGPVYNLEVEGDNSYVCSGITVHNCWWDADDVVDEATAAKLRAIGEAPLQPILYGFSVTYGGLRFDHPRMFPNGSGVRFDETHSCHEFLIANGLRQEFRRDVVIQHRPGQRAEPAATRNLRLLRNDYEKKGLRDSRTLFYFASSLREAGLHQEAVDRYADYLKVSQWREERLFARLYRAQSFRRLKKLPEARRELYSALAEDDRFAEVFCDLGDLSLSEGKPDEAAPWFSLALRLGRPPPDSRLFVTAAKYNEYPRRRLAEIKGAAKPPASSIGELVKVAMQKAQQAKAVKSAARPALVVSLPSLPPVDAVLAVIALQELARQRQTRVAVKTESLDWFFGLAGLLVPETEHSKDAPLPFRLPDGLKGRHRLEWACRALGVVPQGLPRLSLPGLAAKPISPGTEIVLPGYPQFRATYLSSALPQATVHTDGELTAERLALVARAGRVIAPGDCWAYHLARAVGRPTTGLWAGTPDPALAYPETQNLTLGGPPAGVPAEVLLAALAQKPDAGAQGSQPST